MRVNNHIKHVKVRFIVWFASSPGSYGHLQASWCWIVFLWRWKQNPLWQGPFGLLWAPQPMLCPHWLCLFL